MDEVLIAYKSDLAQLKAEFAQAIALMKQSGDEAKKSADKTQKEFKSAAAGVREAAKEIVTTLGIAFGTAQVIQFGKESVKAFLEAEENANKLRFAVTKIGGEGQAAFKKLIEQSEKLQGISIFSDDDIQKAQTQLATLGLNSDQIEKLIPQILDLASATGKDLGSATDTIIQGINGQTRALKSVGLEFENTGDKTKNLSILTEKLGKFQGATAEALETTAGKAKRLENAIDDIKESIGKLIVDEGNELLDFFDIFSKGFDSVFAKKGLGSLQKALSESNLKIVEDAKQSEEKRLALLAESSKRIVKLNEEVQNTRTTLEFKTASELLANEKRLNDELRTLAEKRNNLGGAKIDEATAKAALKLREDTLNALKDLDVKADAERLLETAQTESEKLEILRGAAIKEVQLAEQTAIEKGNKKADVELISQNAIANINKTFDDKQADLARTANEKEFEEAIKFAEAQGDAEAKIVEEKQKERLAKEIENEKRAANELKAIRDEAFSTIAASLSALSTINTNNTNAQIEEARAASDAKISFLEKELQSGKISQEEFNRQKIANDKALEKEQNRLRTREFERNQKIALLNATLSTAAGIARAFADYQYPASLAIAALVGAQGALQIAAIQSEQPPKFEKGGKVKGRRHSAGGTLIEAERDEFVVNRNSALTNNELLNAINSGQTDKYILSNYVVPALKAQQKKFQENKDSGFADNLAKSIVLNSGGFKDGRLLQSLKESRKNERDGIMFLAKVIRETNSRNDRNW